MTKFVKGSAKNQSILSEIRNKKYRRKATIVKRSNQVSRKFVSFRQHNPAK